MDLVEQINTEFDLIDGTTIEKGDKLYLLKSLYAITVKSDEATLSQYQYKSDASKNHAQSRLSGIKEELSAICNMVKTNTESMNNAVTTNDERMLSMHVVVDKNQSEMLFITYTTYSNATDLLDDLSFLRDAKKFIQRKTDMFEFAIKSIDIFGTVYHIEKIEEQSPHQLT